jgi:prepilin-type N-terminal cleavage/methylation domain-containing protein
LFTGLSGVAASAQDGFTMIELMVAIAVLIVGIMGTFVAFEASQRLSLVSERHATMAHIAQREIERVEGIAYSKVALTSTPSTSSDPTNPDYYVVAGSPPSFKWDRLSASAEPVDVDSTAGTIVPVQSWSEGQFSGQIYDFVTWATDPKCSPGCPASGDYKRITVAVTMSAGLHPDPVYVSSVIADPQAMPAGGISNGLTGNPLTNPTTTCKDSSGNTVPCTSPIDAGNPNTFYLHDWPATNTGPVQLPTADHITHATVGVVNNLLCTTSQTLALLLGNNVAGCPTPDLMDTNPPAVNSDGSIPPLFNYSTDQATSGFPGGRVIQPTCSNNTGCGTGSPSDCNNGAWTNSLVNTQSELWVSSPVTATTTLTGEGGVSMFTQTLGSAQALVSFCIEIYDVPPSGSAGSLIDLLAWPPVALGGAGYVASTGSGGGNWPTTPTQVSYIFNFRGSNGAVSIAPGHRLGVRIWIKANANVPIDLLYDNPLYPAQVQLNTQ